MPYFGQQPLSALLPLLSGQNLNDLVDKASARTNLDVFSKSETLLNSTPIGTIIAYWGSTAPAGYLPCSGQTVNATTYPDLVTFLGGSSSAVIPDLRGEFLRGWDNGRGVDNARAIKTAQTDGFPDHGHFLGDGTLNLVKYGLSQGGDGTSTFNTVQAQTIGSARSLTGGTLRLTDETRPRNISVLYCIKAYGAINNVAIANTADILSLVSTATQISQFQNVLGTNGYQKLPNGLIIQWGYSATSNLTVTYPILFPTTVVSVQCTTAQVNTTWQGILAENRAVRTTTSMFVGGYNGSGTLISTCPFNWFAIGY